MIVSLFKIDLNSKNVDKKMDFSSQTIGIFDSGIGGFSVLKELFKSLPEANYYYFSDDAHAPYGPKTDEYITQRSIVITDELIKMGARLIVVACNTATAASIDSLRKLYPEITFVGVEPYLNAIYKESDSSIVTKMAVLTTVSTGKSMRYQNLVQRLDPDHKISHYGLNHLAFEIENYYHQKSSRAHLDEVIKSELKNLVGQNYTHVILGCTHYPLVAREIENITQAQALSPCRYVAQRVVNLVKNQLSNEQKESNMFYLYSSSHPVWIQRERKNLLKMFNL